jgi:hypothetical protein
MQSGPLAWYETNNSIIEATGRVQRTWKRQLGNDIDGLFCGKFTGAGEIADGTQECRHLLCGRGAVAEAGGLIERG